MSVWIMILLPCLYLLTLSLCSPIEPVVSPVPFPELSSDGQLPLAPREEGVTSGDSSSEFSSHRSPQLKSTARDQPRYHLPCHRQGQCIIVRHLHKEIMINSALICLFCFFSPPKMQPVLTSSDSSPQPDRISLDDLTGSLSGT